MMIKLRNDGENKLSNQEWFNKLREQMVDVKDTIEAGINTSTLQTLLKQKDALEQSWAVFLDAYVTLQMTNPGGSSSQFLMERRQTGAVYSEAKEIVESAIKVATAMEEKRKWEKRARLERNIKGDLNDQIEGHLMNMLRIPKMEKFRAKDAQEMIEKVEYNMRILERLGEATCPKLLCVIMSLKLDGETYADWKKVEDKSKAPDIESLLDFLEKRWAVVRYQEEEMAVARQERRDEEERRAKQRDLEKRRARKEGKARPAKNMYCTLCQLTNHKLSYCYKFKQMHFNQKLAFLDSYKVCANCLKSGHSRIECRTRSVCNCAVEEGKHHTLVCRRFYQSQRNVSESESEYDNNMGYYN